MDQGKAAWCCGPVGTLTDFDSMIVVSYPCLIFPMEENGTG